MKKIILALGISLLLAGSPVFAAKWKIQENIQDNYIGGGYVTNGPYTQNNGDVISGNNEINQFNIDNMSVKIDGQGNIKVIVRTDYYPDIGNFGTDYGDLFISTNGWAPNGSSDSNYNEDTFYNTGTSWDYVFDTNSHNLYGYSDEADKAVFESAFLNSEDFFPHTAASWYRKNQVVQINPDALDESISDPVTTGKFKAKPNRGYLMYTGFNLEDLGLSLDESFDLGFRWSMTCANDVIEGDVNWNAVPEPGTMILFGLGLLGIGAVGRKKSIVLD